MLIGDEKLKKWPYYTMASSSSFEELKQSISDKPHNAKKHPSQKPRPKIAPHRAGCVVCKATHHIKYCGGCHSARYCSRVCQKKHWSEHKAKCSKYLNADPADIDRIICRHVNRKKHVFDDIKEMLYIKPRNITTKAHWEQAIARTRAKRKCVGHIISCLMRTMDACAVCGNTIKDGEKVDTLWETRSPDHAAGQKTALVKVLKDMFQYICNRCCVVRNIYDP